MDERARYDLNMESLIGLGLRARFILMEKHAQGLWSVWNFQSSWRYLSNENSNPGFLSGGAD